MDPDIQNAIDEILAAELLVELDPLRYTVFNPAQCRGIKAVAIGDSKLILCPMPNGIGKTFMLVAIMGGIMFPTKNNLFGGVFSDWPYRKQLRFVSTAKNVEDGEAFQLAIKELWPVGHFTQKRGAGRSYFSQINTSTGFDIDILTFNQAPLEHAGGTKGGVFISEPPPIKIFSENIARLRAGGPLFLEMTPLNYAAYIKDKYIDKGGLFDKKGNKVGKIAVITGDIEENCRDHTEGGQLPHVEIQTVIASYPVEEREARETGGFMHLAGLIYTQYGDLNEIDEFPEYHAEMWERGKFNLRNIMDPHDRKPFAIGWIAIFPNDDHIVVAEYPEAPYEDMTNSVDTIETYRKMIIATENDLGRRSDTYLMDPNFGRTPKLGGMTAQQLFAEACEECKAGGNESKCPHRLFYEFPPDPIAEGHLIVRRAVGIPREKVRPKFMVMKHCRNFCYGMRHYGYKESKRREIDGINEQPQLVNKDFPDLVRYDYLWGSDYKAPSRAPVHYKMKKRGRGYHAT